MSVVPLFKTKGDSSNKTFSVAIKLASNPKIFISSSYSIVNHIQNYMKIENQAIIEAQKIIIKK